MYIHKWFQYNYIDIGPVLVTNKFQLWRSALRSSAQMCQFDLECQSVSLWLSDFLYVKSDHCDVSLTLIFQLNWLSMLESSRIDCWYKEKNFIAKLTRIEASFITSFTSFYYQRSLHKSIKYTKTHLPVCSSLNQQEFIIKTKKI